MNRLKNESEMHLFVFLLLLLVSTGLADKNDGVVEVWEKHEADPHDFDPRFGSMGKAGLERFNKYVLTQQRKENEVSPLPPKRKEAERRARNMDTMTALDNPRIFAFRRLQYHPHDAQLGEARLIWGQIQDFLSRCGGNYEDTWCVPVVEFLQSSSAYRELELAVLQTTHAITTKGREETERRMRGERAVRKEHEDDPAESMEAYTRLIRRFLDEKK